MFYMHSTWVKCGSRKKKTKPHMLIRMSIYEYNHMFISEIWDELTEFFVFFLIFEILQKEQEILKFQNITEVNLSQISRN